MMPLECKVANVKSDIEKFIQGTVMEYGIAPYIVVGILSDILNNYKNAELINLNDQFNNILKTINEQKTKEKE